MQEIDLDCILNLINDKELGLESKQEKDNARRKIHYIVNKMTKLLKETATKDHEVILDSFKETEILDYIKFIYEEAYNLREVDLCYQNYKFEEIQDFTEFKEELDAVYLSSKFRSKEFKYKHLNKLISFVGKSKTIHELRQNIKLLIDPLKFTRDNDPKKENEHVKFLTSEMDRLNTLAETRLETINSICGFTEQDMLGYGDVELSEEDQEIALLAQIEGAKETLRISDSDAAKMFGSSRTGLFRLRKKYKSVPS